MYKKLKREYISIWKKQTLNCGKLKKCNVLIIKKKMTLIKFNPMYITESCLVILKAATGGVL